MTKPNQDILDGVGFEYDRPFRVEKFGKRWRVIDAQRRSLDGLLAETEEEALERLAVYQPPEKGGRRKAAAEGEGEAA